MHIKKDFFTRQRAGEKLRRSAHKKELGYTIRAQEHEQRANKEEMEILSMDRCIENVIEFLENQQRATVTFSQGRYKTRIRKLARSRPEECQIVAENKDGSMRPYSYSMGKNNSTVRKNRGAEGGKPTEYLENPQSGA